MAEAPSIDRRVEKPTGDRRCGPVDLDDPRHGRQELCHAPVPSLRRGGIQPPVPHCQTTQKVNLVRAERIRNHDRCGAGEQLARLRSALWSARRRRVGEDLPELGPRRGEDENRSSGRIGEQAAHSGGDRLGSVRVLSEEVVLKLVQPDDRPGADLRQAAGRRPESAGIDRMPESPVVREHVHCFPTSPRLAGRRLADQHGELVASGDRRVDQAGEHLVMRPANVRREVGEAAGTAVRADRWMNLERDRIQSGDRYARCICFGR
jgi:hypothetical protein